MMKMGYSLKPGMAPLSCNTLIHPLPNGAILSIHDSYIVKLKDTGLLRSAMSVACIEVLGADIEAEARTKKDLEYLKYATTWRSMDRDFYLDTFKHLTHFEKCIEYSDRYEEWKKWKGI